MKALTIYENIRTRNFLHWQCKVSIFTAKLFFAITDFYIINPASMDFVLDWIYLKRPRSPYITLF